MTRRLTATPASAAGLKIAIVSTVALLVIAAVATNAHTSAGANPVIGNPAPALFAPALVAPLGAELAAQRPLADKAFAAWAAQHPAQDDAAFRAFAAAALPAPPGEDVTNTELAELRQLAAGRSSAGRAASHWLEVYGEKDIWKLYLSDATETAQGPAKARAQRAFKAVTTFAKTLTATTQQHFHRLPPTILDPSLRKGQASPAKLSYPSKHAVFVYSELGLLSALDPGRVAELEQMAAQVDYSRLYSAGHFHSDLVAGAFLGDLIADYELRTLR
jgi:membrane-associated phospholipid phosphatase